MRKGEVRQQVTLICHRRLSTKFLRSSSYRIRRIRVIGTPFSRLSTTLSTTNHFTADSSDPSNIPGSRSVWAMTVDGDSTTRQSAHLPWRRVSSMM